MNTNMRIDHRAAPAPAQDNVRKRILKAAVARYGRGPQRDKAIEELSELIRALARSDDHDNIAEEMADVRIMLDQLEIIFGNHAAARLWELKKLRRLSERVHVGDEIGGKVNGDA